MPGNLVRLVIRRLSSVSLLIPKAITFALMPALIMQHIVAGETGVQDLNVLVKGASAMLWLMLTCSYGPAQVPDRVWSPDTARCWSGGSHRGNSTLA